MPDFIDKARNGEKVQGTFLKIFAPPLIEMLSFSAIDFVVIDAEHAPFSIRDIDALTVSAKGFGLPVLVRTLDLSSKFIQRVLDIGVDGLVIPQVESADQIESVIKATKFIDGSRGFSSSTRSAGFGIEPMASILESYRRPLIICQIESSAGVENCVEIAEVEGVDLVFIGRADLAVALGETSVKAKSVLEAVSHVFEKVKLAGKPLGAMVGNDGDMQQMREMGASLFIRESDQALFLKAARELFGQRKQCK